MSFSITHIFNGTQLWPNSKKSPNFVQRLNTELKPNLASVVAEKQKAKKRRKI